MKKIVIAALLLGMVACDSPTDSNNDTVVPEVEYRYAYEFKNDQRNDVTLHFSREFDVVKTKTDTKGKWYYVDSLLSTFETVVLPVDSIVLIGSNNDTLLVNTAYYLARVPDRLRAVEYGRGMKWMSDDVY